MPPIRIFIVDDSAVICSIIRRVVERNESCEVIGFAANVAEAREEIVRLKPDVVTLDIAMPGSGVMPFLDELRLGHNPAVVVVSGSATPGSAETADALAHGADACFDKTRIVSEADLFVRTLKFAAARHTDRVTKAPQRRAGY